MARKSNSISLGDAIQDFIDNLARPDGWYQAQVEAMWEDVIGKQLAAQTKQIRVKGSTLTIVTKSEVLAHQLQFHKSAIMDKVNQNLKKRKFVEVQILAF